MPVRCSRRPTTSGRQRVAVLGAGALTQLNVASPPDIIGQTVRIGGIQFVVIGTLKAKGSGDPASEAPTIR